MDDATIISHLNNIPREFYAAREVYYKAWFSPNRPRLCKVVGDGGSFPVTVKVENDYIIYEYE